jgi:hypothetical protein
MRLIWKTEFVEMRLIQKFAFLGIRLIQKLAFLGIRLIQNELLRTSQFSFPAPSVSLSQYARTLTTPQTFRRFS